MDRRFSVLIADENAGCLYALRSSLEREGYDVAQAGSGREALEIIHSEPIHVVVTDIRLPDYSGLDIYHAIKDIRDAFLPCIFTAIEMTARALHEALNEDVVTVLPKPVDRGRLVHAVGWSVNRYYSRGTRPWQRSGDGRRRSWQAGEEYKV